MKQNSFIFKFQVRLSDDWTPRLLVCGAFELQMSACRLECVTCGETGSVGGYCYSISQHINSTIEECCVKQKWKINISTALFDWRAEGRERHGDTERRHRGERQDTLIWMGFSPYITVRSTLQPPLEREHVVNTSSSGQSLQSDYTLTGYMWIRNQKCICCFAKIYL